MFSFFRRHKSNTQVPEWAGFFSATEYERFLIAVAHYFKNKGLNYELGDGEIYVDDLFFGAETLGLVNVAQVCKQSKPVQWKDIVAEHFDTMHKLAAFETEVEKKLHDFSAIKEYIGVRLYPNDYISNLDENSTIGKPITDDIFAMVVFDFPHGIRNIQRDQAKEWNISKEELFEIGVRNIQSNYEFEISRQTVGKFSIWFVQGDHFFAPNIIFDLENNPQLIGSKGSLIGIPHRHSVLIYPIEDLEVVTAITQLIQIVYGMNQEGPGSISNQLFWYNDDHFTTLPYQLDEQSLKFYPPEDFVDLLNTLKESG